MNFQNKINNFKGNKMLRTRSISTIASIALLGSLGFSGCSDSDKAAALSTATPVAATTTVSTSTTSVNSESKFASAVVTGRVTVDRTATNRTTMSVNNTSNITAYNLSDGTKYQSVSDASGNYTLGGLTEGTYQIIASSTATTKRSVRQVEVKRSTRQVVDIVLQAAGNIKGRVVGAYEGMLVTILGTESLALTDKDGNFELKNVPVGEVTLSVGYPDSEGMLRLNVAVMAGETVIAGNSEDSSGFIIDPYKLNVMHSDMSWASLTLGLQHEGVKLVLNRYLSNSELNAQVHLYNAAGEPVEADISREDYYYSEISVKTKGLAEAGEYRVVVTDSEGTELYSKTFMSEAKAVAFNHSGVDGNGFYYNNIELVMPIDIGSSFNPADITVLDSTGAAVAVTSVNMMPEDGVSGLFIEGDFQSGANYSVVLSGDLATIADGVVYPTDYGLANSLYIQGVEIQGLYPYDGESEVDPEYTDVTFEVAQADGLNLATLVAIFDGKEYTVANGGLEVDQYYNNWGNDYVTVRLKGVKLDYAHDYTLNVEAEDAYGMMVSASSAFSTITPKTVGIFPNNMSNDNESIYELIFHNAPITAYFNTEVEGGKITLYDVTHDKEVPLMDEEAYYSRMYNMIEDHQYSDFGIRMYPEYLEPSTTYRVDVQGFSSKGMELAAESTTFTTLERGVYDVSVGNGEMVDASWLNNTIEFGFFGKLSEEEKAAFVEGLTITSNSLAMDVDASHPEPITVWEETPMGERLYIAFTIDEGKSYEIAFPSAKARELGIPSSKLTFMTRSYDNTTPPPADQLINVNVINYAYLNDDDVYFNEYNLSDSSTGISGSVSINLPLFMDESYNSDSYTMCYESDINASEIRNWISGDVNVTNENVYTSYSYHGGERLDYVCDNSGCHNVYAPSYYSCDANYNASLSVEGVEYNSTYSANVTVPAEMFLEGVEYKDTVRDMMLKTPNIDGYNLQTYGNMVEIYFNAPVLKSDLDNLMVMTTPNVDVKPPYSYMTYMDGNNTYVTSATFEFGSSPYSILQYNLTTGAGLTLFDITKPGVSDVKLNINASGVIHTEADLMPLETEGEIKAINENTVALRFTRDVDMNDVITRDENGTITFMAFNIMDVTDETNVTTVSIKDIQGYGNELAIMLETPLDVNNSYTLELTEAISAVNSQQMLQPFTQDIILPEEFLRSDLPFDMTILDHITIEGEQRVYNIPVMAGETYTINFMDSDNNNNGYSNIIDAKLTIENNDYIILDHADVHFYQEAYIDQDGMLTITVESLSGSGLGDFLIKVTPGYTGQESLLMENAVDYADLTPSEDNTTTETNTTMPTTFTAEVVEVNGMVLRFDENGTWESNVSGALEHGTYEINITDANDTGAIGEITFTMVDDANETTGLFTSLDGMTKVYAFVGTEEGITLSNDIETLEFSVNKPPFVLGGEWNSTDGLVVRFTEDGFWDSNVSAFEEHGSYVVNITSYDEMNMVLEGTLELTLNDDADAATGLFAAEATGSVKVYTFDISGDMNTSAEMNLYLDSVLTHTLTLSTPPQM